MSDLSEVADRVKDQLNRANREPYWEPGEAARYMADVGDRRAKFQQLASELVATVIKPRLEVVAAHFANASQSREEPGFRRSYWFGYCERFPASTKVAISVEHDVRFEKLAVCYEAVMMPVFIKLIESDKLTTPLEEVDKEAIANWVEDRLLDFVDAYLQIDRGGDDFDDESVIDPVCGMRIGRKMAVSRAGYCGHSYYFCSPECQERFALDPRAYVDVSA